jgi:hypothetical protein
MSIFKIVTDVPEQFGFSMLVCVMIAIASGVHLSFLLLTALGVFSLLDAINAYRGYTAERLQPAAMPYLDALANVLVTLGIYVTCLLVGVRALLRLQAQSRFASGRPADVADVLGSSSDNGPPVSSGEPQHERPWYGRYGTLGHSEASAAASRFFRGQSSWAKKGSPL